MNMITLVGAGHARDLFKAVKEEIAGMARSHRMARSYGIGVSSTPQIL